MIIPWGLQSAVPANALAAWGCRAIVKRQLERIGRKKSVEYKATAYIDVPWDRRGYAEDAEYPDQEELQSWLKGHKEIWDKIRRLIVDGDIRPDEAKLFTIFSDDRVEVACNTNASHGYLYVAAWLKPEEK